ncbi:hypothetical protein CLCR_05150 [Cladophialophora carrionii]|uniref:Mid2 domain-containing protein n=1 Tax=Cladophialophora carrionii TaxID=86049 RepID=A0A1C1CJI4_9EURO|nr:hypothetical protein CLCR_05150 [Cladophialophora carrionii]
MADSCGQQITVTVTQTILQGAATRTTNAPASSDQSTPLSSSASTSSDADDGHASPVAFGFLPVSISDTTLTTLSPATTMTLNLVHATSSSGRASVSKATSASSECPKPTVSAAATTASPKSSTPPGTIAGGVIGSMAGLAVIIALLLYCCRRKRKITFRRKVQKTDQEDQAHVLESITQEKDEAVRQLEQTRQSKPLPSPRSFDFGLPKIQHSTSPVMPQRWI